MKAIRKLGLVASAALVVMAFAGVSSATAESTALCIRDQAVFNGSTYVGTNECPAVNRIFHIHEATLAGAKMKLLTNFFNIECDVLFLGEVVSAANLGAPLEIEGEYTYLNCGACTVEEVGELAALEVLREGHENAKVELLMEMEVECGVIDCTYLWAENGTAKGPLLSTELNGEVKFFQQPPIATGGIFCPGQNKLDLTTTPLIETYIAR